MDYVKYYKVLNLPTTATAEEIKRAYRRLAAQYHPDRNPDGADMFLQIKEAYEVLTGKITVVTQTTTRHSSPHPQSSRSETRNNATTREERIRMAKKRYEEQKKKEEQQNIRFYNNLISGNSYKWFKYGAFFSMLISALLALDLLLPPIKETQMTQSVVEVPHDISDQVLDYLRDLYGDSTIQLNQVNVTDSLITESGFEYSRIFKEKSYVIGVTTDQAMEKLGVNDTLWGIICFLLIPIFALAYKRMNATFILLFYISLYILIPISVLIAIAKMYTLGSYYLI